MKTIRSAKDIAMALEPFHQIGQWLFARPEVPDDETMIEVHMANGAGFRLTRGQFKAASRAYIAVSDENDD